MKYRFGKVIRLDDEFRHTCLDCGECCKDPPTPTPVDLCNLAKHFGIPPAEVVNNFYTTVGMWGDFPRSHIKTGKFGRCVFGQRTPPTAERVRAGCKCSLPIHARPSRCKLRPVCFRLNHFDGHTDFVALDMPCPGLYAAPARKFGSWLKMIGMDEYPEDTIKFFLGLHSAKMAHMMVLLLLPPDAAVTVGFTMHKILTQEYDPARPLIPQIEDNTQIALKVAAAAIQEGE